MRKLFVHTTLLLLSAIDVACGSNDHGGAVGPSATDGAAAGTRATAAAGTGIASGGSSAGSGADRGGSSSGGRASSQAGGSAGSAGAAGAASADDAAGAGGSAGSRGDGASGNSDGSGTALNGTLGALGAVQPTVSSLVIANSGEVLIYMSSAPISCELLTTSRWLGMVEAGSQVVEVVVPSARTEGKVPVEEGGAEVNYAPGGMSSAYEKAAASGSVTFSLYTPNRSKAA